MAGVTVRELPLAETRALRRAVLRPRETIEDMAAHEPLGAYAVGAFEDGTLISVGLIGREGGEHAWRVRGMATLERERGRGAGRAVLDALVAHALAQGAARVWCNARVGAVPFYARAGFSTISEEFDIPGIGPHFVMERRLA